jgi:hypothetical protein
MIDLMLDDVRDLVTPLSHASRHSNVTVLEARHDAVIGAPRIPRVGSMTQEQWRVMWEPWFRLGPPTVDNPNAC